MMLYPIAEQFQAPQGEGRYAGVLMNFVRFGGCTVGKPFPKEKYQERYSTDSSERPLHLPIYTEQCTLYDGRTFACDTDYRIKERLTADQIMENINYSIPYVLFTGGEPLMRDVSDLVKMIRGHKMEVHVETSGTIKPDFNNPQWRMINWICVSPKKGFLDEYADANIANEFKLLVDDDFTWESVPESIRRKPQKICISAINGEHTIDHHNVQRCLAIQMAHPLVRVTMQLHKILGTR